MVDYETIYKAYKGFVTLDKDNSSGLTKTDLMDYVKKAYPDDPKNKLRTERLFDIFGKRYDEKISFYEWLLLSMD